MIKLTYIVPLLTGCAGLALGYFAADWRHDASAQEARCQNYTDRARICIEAAALLRANQPIVARKHLEGHANAAIAGVAMWRSYDDLSEDSQALMVTAKIYDRSFEGVDFDLGKRIRGEIPNDHRWLSTNTRGIAAKLGG